MPPPNFFIVGAPKAGTTSLYQYLRQHPDIFMSPIKEPCFFSLEVRPERSAPGQRERISRLIDETRRRLRDPMKIAPDTSGIVTTWDDYLRLFLAANGERAIGEASVGYMVSETAAAGIAARIPHARIIMVLRSPIYRAFSQYQHVATSGFITQSFHDFLHSALRDDEDPLGVYKPLLEMGYYASQVQRYLDNFPSSQVAIWIYEETRRSPQDFLRQVFRFLNVDDSFVPDMSQRYNQPRLPRLLAAGGLLRRVHALQPRRFVPRPLRSLAKRVIYRTPGSLRMDPADRALLLELYRPDILRLQGILNRDLSGWLA